MEIDVPTLVGIIQSAKCKVRLKLKKHPKPEAWGNRAIIPVRTYIEVIGPWPMREVEWLEIDPIITEHIGRLVAPRIINSFFEIEARLREAEFSYTVSDSIIRILF